MFLCYLEIGGLVNPNSTSPNDTAIKASVKATIILHNRWNLYKFELQHILQVFSLSFTTYFNYLLFCMFF